jgi:tetratricopeptide (TPR) repeat protein
MVREIAGLPEGEVLDRIDELLDRHLIRESIERGRYEYAFTHHLIHAAIYETVPEDSRTRRHRRVARILADASPGAARELAAEVALHYERGGEPLKAAPFYATAARRAAELHANAEARDLITRSLTLGVWDARTTFELLTLRSRMHSRLGNADDERADLSALESVAATLDDEARCAALVRQVELAIRYDGHAAERDAVERLGELAHASGSERWLAAAAEARARSRHRELDYAHALEDALEARDRYRALGDTAACASATALAGHMSSLIPGGADDAATLADEALTLADPAGNVELFLETLSNVSIVAQERQDYPRMVEVCETALAHCLRVGDRTAETHRRGSLGIALWGCWRFPEALRELQEAFRLADALRTMRVLPTVVCNIGGLLLDVGDYAAGEPWLQRAEAVSLETGSIATAMVALTNLADLYWQTCRLDDLRRVLDRSEALSARTPESRYRASLLVNRGRLFRCERKFEDSVSALERAASLMGETGRWSDAAEALDDLALTHLGSGNMSAARDALQRGAERVGEGTHTYPIRHLWIEACVRRASADYEESRLALQRGHGIFAEQQAKLDDPALRAAFEAMPVHRAVKAALTHDEWPAPGVPCLVAFAATQRSR